MEVFSMKKELRVGILLQVIYLILDRFFNIPDFTLGLLLGFGLCLIVIGLLPEKTYFKIKKLRLILINKLKRGDNMKNLENHKRPYTFGLGLSFIPLGFVTGMVNDKPVIGLFVGLLVALIIELIRYNKLKKV